MIISEVQAQRADVGADGNFMPRTFDESDPEFVAGSFQTLNESEYMQEGFLFSIGVRW